MAAVRVLYFAWLRERAGCAEEAVVLPAEVRDVGALMGWLGARNEGLRQAFEMPRLVRAAVNQDFAQSDAAVADGDEVAFFPPVTGG